MSMMRLNELARQVVPMRWKKISWIREKIECISLVILSFGFLNGVWLSITFRVIYFVDRFLLSRFRFL